MLQNAPLLSLTIWVPIAFGIAVLAMGRDANPLPVRWTALVGSILGLLVSLPLWVGFQPTAEMQFVELRSWISRFNVNYHLGVDGISMPLLILNSLMTVLVVVAHWEVITEKVSQYLAAFLIMSGLINGVFASLDAVLFYVFFEAMLIPMFLIIGVWGGPNRVYAAVKFFLYTLLGSLLMLAAFIYLYMATNGSFEILDWHKLQIPLAAQVLIFLAMFMSFAVKVPMWPVHTWLPDAHVEAPTGGSVILAAITLKIGGYGFLRFNLPIAPDASHLLDGFMITLSLVAVVYIGLVALVQGDMKKLIAYSSISHMGFVTLGFFIFNADGMLGGMMQMVSHGFISAALFLCVGVLYDRVHSRQIADYGGVANTMPVFAAFFVLFAMANSGLPGTSGFVGEFFVILGTIKVSFWYAFLAATTLVFGAAYTLWMVKRVIYGAVANPNVAALRDVNRRELAFLVILAVAVLWMGLYPAPFAEVMNPTIRQLLEHVAQSKVSYMNMATFSLATVIPAMPEIVLSLLVFLLLMIDALIAKGERRITYVLAIVALVGTALLTARTIGAPTVVTFNGLFVADPMSQVLKVATLLTVAATLMLGRTYLEVRGLLTGEFLCLALFSTLGMMVMISAQHFLTLYLGLELMALSQYALVALQRDSTRATEAGMKYFVLGALSSGLLLYGMSMIYGATGSLEITRVAFAIEHGEAQHMLGVFGLVFVVAGIAFKLGAAPFHMWVPDVYHGAATPATLLVGGAPKIAAFGFVMRLLADGLQGFTADWQQMLVVLAVMSMLVGNIVAIAQTNVKRMLAYSTISHMGFLLLGILAGNDNGYGSAMFYLIAYVLMTLGSFGMILVLSRAGFEAENLDDFRGLNQKSKWYAFVMMVMMFSLTGLPPTVGFFAKLAVLQAVLEVGYTWLVVLAVLLSVVGAFYYLRIVKLMYMDPPAGEITLDPRRDARWVLSVTAIATLVLGIFPSPLLDLCTRAIAASM